MSNLLLNHYRYFLIIFFFYSCQFNRLKRFEQLINTAKESLSNKKYDESLKCLNEAISIKPDSIVGYSLRGQLLYETKKFELSKKDFRTALSFNPESTASLFYLGINCFNLDQNDSAIFYYTKAISTKSEDSVYLEINNNGIFGKNYSEDISMKIIKYYRGVSYFMVNEYGNAFEDFLFSINQKYNIGDSYLYLGVMELDYKDSSRGCKYLRLAFENGCNIAQKYLQENCH